MTAGPSRRERRNLKKRGDRLLAKIKELAFVSAPDDYDARTHVIVADEERGPIVLRRELVPFTLLALGCYADFVSLFVGIEEDRKNHAGSVPVILLTDAWLSVAWMRATALSKGVDA